MYERFNLLNALTKIISTIIDRISWDIVYISCQHKVIRMTANYFNKIEIFYFSQTQMSLMSCIVMDTRRSLNLYWLKSRSDVAIQPLYK